MRLLLTFTALFMSDVLLQFGSGGVAPLDALSGIVLHFSNAQIGMLGSAHFLGFLIGCWWTPRLMGTVGHARAFSAFAAAGTIGILSHMLWVNPFAWIAMRMLSGMCVAGCYTIIEAWLNARLTNESRGRMMGIYRTVDAGGSFGAQLFIGFLPTADFVSYNLLAILCCAALFPVALTRMELPPTPEAPRLRPKLAWDCSPLGSLGVMVAGATGSSFRMVGPLYGAAIGLSVHQIALFLATYVAGGWVAQMPVGALADRYDRRVVLIGLSAGTMVAAGATVMLAHLGTGAVLATAALFGFTTFPLYSVSSAHGHDFAETAERVELSSAQMFLWASGAIASPIIASTLISVAGPASMFAFIAAVNGLLIVFGLARMKARPSRRTRTRFVSEPRTSFLIGQLQQPLRDEGPEANR
ncbi:MAG: MFS transporter [Rhodobacteraceae bacterium]|nr:MFS transporter [Paracoccaceae bacterium]